jgi:hypothetical protein
MESGTTTISKPLEDNVLVIGDVSPNRRFFCHANFPFLGKFLESLNGKRAETGLPEFSAICRVQEYKEYFVLGWQYADAIQSLTAIQSSNLRLILLPPLKGSRTEGGQHAYHLLQASSDGRGLSRGTSRRLPRPIHDLAGKTRLWQRRCSTSPARTNLVCHLGAGAQKWPACPAKRLLERLLRALGQAETAARCKGAALDLLARRATVC